MNLRTAVSVAILAGAAALVAPAPAQAADSYPAHYSAPYLELSDSSVGDLAADLAATGTRYYTLAFLIPNGGCNQIWEASGQGVGAYATQIQALKNAGGTVAVSFGGAAGGEVAQTCTNVASLQAAYANVVNTYGITHLDFDIEESTFQDTAANARRNQALAALQAANPAVAVDFTLAVAPNGLPSAQLNLVKDAVARGVKVNAVNIMTMDFGNGRNALNDALSAANATHTQLAQVFGGLSSAQLWNKIGLTPIAGQNDDDEFFSQSDAQTLETFAATNGVQKLAFWEVHSYDRATGWAYSRIFNRITGGATPPPAGGGARITGLGGKCVDVAAAGTADGTAVQLWTCNGTTAQQWTAGSGGTFRALGKCLDVASGSSADGAKVQLWTCNGSAAQQWTASGGTLRALGKCLDATGPSSADGTRLQIWTCTGGSNQTWTVG